MFSIRSNIPHREMVFSNYDGHYFSVEIKGVPVTAVVRIYDYTDNTDNTGLAEFFGNIASYRIPWEGSQTWGSLEGDFNISATCSNLGNIALDIILSSEDWKVEVVIVTDLGQLDLIAKNARLFFRL